MFWDKGKPQKSLLLTAGPLRGGGGGPAIKEKKYFLFFCYLKIKDILLKKTYQNINTANVGKVVVFYYENNLFSYLRLP